MAYVGADFSPCDVGESQVYSLDFTNDLDPGEAIVATTWTCADRVNVDPSPASAITAMPAIGNVAQVRLATTVPYANYSLECVAATSLGNTIILYSHVRVNQPA